MHRPRRAHRPLRKRPRLEDLADEEPESSSEATSSTESSDASPPPDFAADADEEHGYTSSLQQKPPLKPRSARPSRLAKPRSFLDAVRPYVAPMSKDAIKLSKLTMAEISAGAAYRGPLVVTEADRAEVQTAHAAAAKLAEYDSDEHVEDREQVLPQVQTRPYSLKKQTRSDRHAHSNSDSELSPETCSETDGTTHIADSPQDSPHSERRSNACLGDDSRAKPRKASGYEPEKDSSPPKFVLRLVRNDKVDSGNRSSRSDTDDAEVYPDDTSENSVHEPTSAVDNASKQGVIASQHGHHSEFNQGKSHQEKYSKIKNFNSRQIHLDCHPSNAGDHATDYSRRDIPHNVVSRENIDRVVRADPGETPCPRAHPSSTLPKPAKVFGRSGGSTDINENRNCHRNEVEPTAVSRVIDFIDLCQNENRDVRTSRRRPETVQTHSDVSYSINRTENTSVMPQFVAPSRVLDFIDLSGEEREDRGEKEAPTQLQTEVFDLCSDDDDLEEENSPPIEISRDPTTRLRAWLEDRAFHAF